MAALDAEDLHSSALKYFGKTSYINRQIVHQENLFIKYLGDRWNEIPSQHKDALLDLLHVKDDIRGAYYDASGETIGAKRTSQDVGEIAESFPRLYLNSGQKINVDFENDLWTWRDEHSGPFSWMSRSQQDLTLADLEPDNISKPQAKSLRVDADESVFTTKPDPQLNLPSSCWCHDIIDEFRKHEQDIVLTPSPSVNLAASQAEIGLEEVNPAFQTSNDNLSQTSTPGVEANSASGVTQESDAANSPDKKSKGKDRSRRSPSPKKILRSGSFKKSPGKTSDQGEQKLITGDETETEDGAHVFSNPVMESEWSTFVGEDNSKSSSYVPEPSKVEAPQSMIIDRGVEMGSSSPYRVDQICLLDRQSETESSSSIAAHASQALSDWSAESTPDHTTHLLKGMQSPVHHRHPVQTSDLAHAQAGLQPSYDLAPELMDSPERDIPPVVRKAETEEVLRVELEGDKILVTTEPESEKDDDIPRTGFDFLDNW